MKRSHLLTAAVTVLALAAPATASASYFVTQAKAEHYPRNYFHSHVGYPYTSAACRPQGASSPKAGYVYHRWVCAFAVGDSRYNPSCTGQIRISGSSDGGSYYSLVLWHDGRCPWGVNY